MGSFCSVIWGFNHTVVDIASEAKKKELMVHPRLSRSLQFAAFSRGMHCFAQGLVMRIAWYKVAPNNTGELAVATEAVPGVGMQHAAPVPTTVKLHLHYYEAARLLHQVHSSGHIEQDAVRLFLDERRAWIDCVGDLLIKRQEVVDDMESGDILTLFANCLIKPLSQQHPSKLSGPEGWFGPNCPDGSKVVEHNFWRVKQLPVILMDALTEQLTISPWGRDPLEFQHEVMATLIKEEIDFARLLFLVFYVDSPLTPAEKAGEALPLYRLLMFHLPKNPKDGFLDGGRDLAEEKGAG